MAVSFRERRLAGQSGDRIARDSTGIPRGVAKRQWDGHFGEYPINRPSNRDRWLPARSAGMCRSFFWQQQDECCNEYHRYTCKGQSSVEASAYRADCADRVWSRKSAQVSDRVD